MRLNKTQKHLNIRHKTKLIHVYGGVDGTNSKLSVKAQEFIPMTRHGEAPVNGIPEFMRHFLENKARIENAVALDCEMVGVGSESVLAHVAIVDFNGNEIYNKYVIPRSGINSITSYRTKYSGIRRATLKNLNKERHGFNKIKDEVHKILKDRIIVGHGLANDFKVLEFIPNPDNVWDTTEIDIYKKSHPHIPGLRQPKKLKVLAMEIAGNNIQKNTGLGHSPLEDARSSMNLYRLSFFYPKITYNNMSK